jgi:hypothetical protein
MESKILVLQELVMTDPRFFRRYLDILAEQPTSATLNVGNNSSLQLLTKLQKPSECTTNVGYNLNLQATQDLAPGGARLQFRYTTSRSKFKLQQ